MDRLLQRYLKNWAARQQAPETVKPHLLLLAASRSYMMNEYQYRHEDVCQTPKEFYNLQVSEPAKVFDLIWVFNLPMPALRMV